LAAERTEKDPEEERGTRRWAAEGAAVAGGGQRRGEILIVVVAQLEFFLPTGTFIPRRSGKGIPQRYKWYTSSYRSNSNFKSKSPVQTVPSGIPRYK
jgi:hypothetical protein